MGKYDHIDFTPPAGVRSEAEKGLAWRKEHGRGGTAIGVARARDLSNGTNISPETAKRMRAYFERHEVDKQGQGWSPGEAGFPSAGRIAWALWGGDPGRAWANKLVRQMDAADSDESRKEPQMSAIESRMLWNDSDEDAPVLTVESRSEEIEVNGEKRQVQREWIVGYAARFGVNSLDLGDFIERIDPGAFGLVAERRGRKSPLETRALFNHDPNHVLGRFPTTLRMKVDERGLRYEILPPETRRDIVELIQRGDIRGSSFSFMVDEQDQTWSMEEGRTIRTINRVKALIDVGPVTFPAYPDTHVEVAKRSYEQWMEKSTAEKAAEQIARSRALAERRAIVERNREFLKNRGY